MGSVALEGFGGSGGVSLNFKVVGGTTEPSSPKKNTIWIDTDQKITGWEFSATEPSLNLVKSSFVNSNKNVYAGVLYVDFDLQPNTTYTMFFNGQDGNNYYINESLFKNYTVVKVGAERTVVHFTAKDTDISGSYTDGMGWLILKNDKDQANDHIFDDLQIVEGNGNLEGMVWITTGTSSTVEFNALKKNGIQVYPAGVKQYINGEWKPKESHIYKDNSWLPINRLYLIKDGIIQEGISFTATSNGTITTKDGRVLFTTAGNNNDAFYAKIQNAGYSIMRIQTGEFENEQSYRNVTSHEVPTARITNVKPVQPSSSDTIMQNVIASVPMYSDIIGGKSDIVAIGDLDLSVDISSNPDFLYPMVYIGGSNGVTGTKGKVSVTNWWFE